MKLKRIQLNMPEQLLADVRTAAGYKYQSLTEWIREACREKLLTDPLVERAEAKYSEEQLKEIMDAILDGAVVKMQTFDPPDEQES